MENEGYTVSGPQKKKHKEITQYTTPHYISITQKTLDNSQKAISKSTKALNPKS